MKDSHKTQTWGTISSLSPTGSRQASPSTNLLAGSYGAARSSGGSSAEKSKVWWALEPLKSQPELLVVHLISFQPFSSLQFSTEFSSSSPLSFCRLFLWTPIAVSGKCVFRTYKERPLYPRGNLYYIAQSPVRICLCVFQYQLLLPVLLLLLFWLAFPIFPNPSYQQPSQAPQYAILFCCISRSRFKW